MVTSTPMALPISMSRRAGFTPAGPHCLPSSAISAALRRQPGPVLPGQRAVRSGRGAAAPVSQVSHIFCSVDIRFCVSALRGF